MSQKKNDNWLTVNTVSKPLASTDHLTVDSLAEFKQKFLNEWAVTPNAIRCSASSAKLLHASFSPASWPPHHALNHFPPHRMYGMEIVEDNSLPHGEYELGFLDKEGFRKA